MLPDAKKADATLDLIQFLTFDLVNSNPPVQMALNIQKVKEVVDCHKITPVISERKVVLGLYDLRGAPVPILDILALVKEKTSNATAEFKLPVRLLICELQNLWLAIPVARTRKIISCKTQDFMPPPKIMESQHEIRYLTGLIRMDEVYVPVLDLDSLLESLGITTESKNESPDRTMAFAGKRVLLVEDSIPVQKKMALFFRKLGLEVFVASNGQEGLQRLSELGGKVDLIFTDIEMPVKNGIEMVREIRNSPRTSHIPVLFNSALSNPALIETVEAEQLGKYLVKFDEEKIFHQVKRELKL
jgi:two-component system chemotaxis response regulator CheV